MVYLGIKAVVVAYATGLRNFALWPGDVLRPSEPDTLEDTYYGTGQA